MRDSILLLGAGRRVSFARYLSQYFKIESLENSDNTPLDVIDSCKVHNSAHYGNDDKTFIKRLLANTRNNKICVIPLMDNLTVLLANEKQTNCNKNVIPLVGSHESTVTAYDKREFERFMLQEFEEYYPKAAPGAVVVKPRYGRSSRGVYKANVTKDELNLLQLDQNNVVQLDCSVDSALVEMSCDVFFGIDNQIVGLCVRQRTRVEGGEVVDSKTCPVFNNRKSRQFKALFSFLSELGLKLKVVGPLCVQFFGSHLSDSFKVFEINARFGGGVVLSIHVGLNVAKYINQVLYEESPRTFDVGVGGVRMIRYHSEYYVNESQITETSD